MTSSAPLTADPPSYPVRVIRSTRRKRTAAARLTDDGIIEVRIPAHFSAADEEHYVTGLAGQIQRQCQSHHTDLMTRARTLARRYDLKVPDIVEWSPTMRTTLGRCTPATGRIRISMKLADAPGWVLDYVLVHELAHLSVLPHNAAFHALVDRYPKAERARGYLMARSLPDSSPWVDGHDTVEPVDEPVD